MDIGTFKRRFFTEMLRTGRRFDEAVSMRDSAIKRREKVGKLQHRVDVLHSKMAGYFLVLKFLTESGVVSEQEKISFLALLVKQEDRVLHVDSIAQDQSGTL